MNIPVALEFLVKLLRLNENWDGEGGRRIAPETALKAMEVLVSLDRKMPQLPLPSIVPMSDGGIQLDWWKEGQAHLEIECRFDEDHPTFCICDMADADHTFEGNFAHDYDDLLPYLERLKETSA